MTNLLKAIEGTLLENNKTIEDIEFISTIKDNELVEIEPKEFWTMAKYFYYDNNYGGDVLDENLKLVGENFWLETARYDGASWFEFKLNPPRPQKIINEYIPVEI